jgi:uncharacterized protein (DUF2384 family)
VVWYDAAILRYAKVMGATRVPAATGLPEQAYQLEHPSSEVIWQRAIEVFGNEELARKWLQTPLPILNEYTPEQCALSGDSAKQREVLVILGRIDYGIFS